MKLIPHTYNPYQKPVEALFVLLFGGVTYYGIETLSRGWSHWSMAICGAVCFFFLYRLNERYQRVSLPLRALAGALFITATELLVGCLLNLGMGLAIWDYSDMPYQFWGQICLPYSIFWFLLCFPAALVCRVIRRVVFLRNA